MFTFNKTPVAPSGCQFKVVTFEPKDTPPSQSAPPSSLFPQHPPEKISETGPIRRASKIPQDLNIAGPSNPKPPRTFVERRGVDALDRLLLGPEPGFNIFTMNAISLASLLKMHHIQSPPGLSMDGMRQAAISHFMGGLCMSVCDPDESHLHVCHCQQFCGVFPSRSAMMYSVISMLVSASEERLPDSRMEFVASSLGLSDKSRLRFNLFLDQKRTRLVEEQASKSPLDVLFNRLENLPKGTLVAIAQAHGIRFAKTPSASEVKSTLMHHISTGFCSSREGHSSYLGCSSVSQEFDPYTAEPGTAGDPATMLQIHIIQQIAPVLNIRSLRRLLDLHDVSYKSSDPIKKLRLRLKGFLQRLIRGKYGDSSDFSLTGSKRKARARELPATQRMAPGCS
jgi:hypothetical protein